MALDSSTYGTTAGVARLLRDKATATGLTFDTTTTPTLAQVEVSLDETADYIDGLLIGLDIVIPLTSTNGKKVAAVLNNYLAAAYLEGGFNISRGQSRPGGGVPSGRGASYYDMFKNLWEGVADAAVWLRFGESGSSDVFKNASYVGGVSIDDRDDVESDEDRPIPAFKRGMMRNLQT